jgi:putative tryptophan/tyrosine transport system substrate-binding protein
VEGQQRLAAFLQGLKEAGWEVGRNVRIDIRSAADIELNSKYAMELLSLAPDVFLAAGAPTVRALQKATRTVPIVFTSSADPVGAGLVASLGRPSGNVTGFSSFEYSIGGKWLELLKQIAPTVTRVAVVRDPDVPAGIGQFGAIQAVAPYVGVELRPIDTRDSSEIEQAMNAFTRQTGGGLIVTQNTSVLFHRKLIIALAARHRLPAVYASRFLVTDGGLLSYGPNLSDNYRRAAVRGSHPQGRETGRLAGTESCQARAGHQSQDRQCARHLRAAGHARERRRGDRIGSGDVSSWGTKPTSKSVRRMSAVRGNVLQNSLLRCEHAIIESK